MNQCDITLEAKSVSEAVPGNGKSGAAIFISVAMTLPQMRDLFFAIWNEIDNKQLNEWLKEEGFDLKEQLE